VNQPLSHKTAAIPPFAIFLLAMLALLWGLNWPVMKLSLAEYPPFVFRAVAGISAGLGLFALARVNGPVLRVPRAEWKGLIIVSLLNMSVWNIAVLYGIDLMESGRAAILAYTMPLWATLTGAWLVKEPLRARSVLALGLTHIARRRQHGPGPVRLRLCSAQRSFVVLAAPKSAASSLYLSHFARSGAIWICSLQPPTGALWHRP